MADSPGGFDLPEGFALWPQSVRDEWFRQVHDLYFPKLRWWEKPETFGEDSGPRGKQLPPDHPRHTELDLQGYHCGCDIQHPDEDRDRELDCGCGGNENWWINLLLTGRGWGKTKMGSNWVIEMALSKPGIYIGVCAPTDKGVRSICFEGEAGIIAEARRNSVEIADYNKNRLEITFANDSRVRGFSAEKPDSIRGENLSYAWFDELAVIRYMSFYHEGLMPAMRKGQNPRLLITTTPKRIRLLRELLADGENEPETGVHVVRGHTHENPHFAERQRKALERKYAGTYMLKQELEGELVGELDGCLFPLEKFNETRVLPGTDELPQWRRVVVAIDPATTAKESSDETGVVVVAEGTDGDFYVLEDCSGRYAPDQQMRVVAEAFYRNSADCVVGEVNMTGDYMRALLSTVDPNIPLRTVHGMKGKVARAQGPSSLFFQDRIHMVGDTFGKLEDQLSAMTESDDRSRMHDDRADACLADGTLVLTGRGEIPIEQVVPGDLAWTRAGWKPVTATRCTQRNAEVIAVRLSDGRKLTGTGDHRIWTENDGWKRLDALVWGDILSGWKNPLLRSRTRATPTGVTRTARAAATGFITSTTRQPGFVTSTAISGLTITLARKSRPAGTSTTTTRTRSTTTRRTSSSSRRPFTVSSIPGTSRGKRNISSTTWSESARSLPNGTAPRRDMSGTSSTARMAGRIASGSLLSDARSAAPSSNRGTTTRSGARRPAPTALARRTRSTARRSLAQLAGASFSATSTGRRDPSAAPVSVLGSCASGERRDVYDLTVADVHEFTAGGVIVHNCIWGVIHLSGNGQGDWGVVYGFRDCTKCGARVNEDKDQRCKNCGAEITPLPAKHAGGRPAQVPWSAAYLSTCVNEACGKTYARHERSCPHCSPDPATYMRRALALSGMGGGKLGYSGRDVTTGRRL